MRAIYHPTLYEIFEDENLEKIVRVIGPQLHHLQQVVRLKEGESVLIMDGLGHMAYGVVATLSKQEMLVDLDQVDKVVAPTPQIDLALCLPKKPAQLDAIRASVELGIGRIIPVLSEFAWRGLADDARINRVMESAMLQSNNPILPEVLSPVDFDQLVEEHFDQYDSVLAFTLDDGMDLKALTSAEYGEHILLVIGPEGGESLREKERLAQHPQVKLINLSMPILRTETAVAVATGFLHGQISS